MAISKAQLIDAIALNTGITKRAAGEALQTLTEIVTDELSTGGEVVISGFGKFHASARKARTARVPGTDRTVEVPAKVVPKFTPSKTLKDAIGN